MNNSKPTELCIKLAHIGMEPSIIRKHEKRIKNRIQYLKDKQSNDGVDTSYNELHRLQHHRRWVVRNEARATHLALGFLSGKSYKAMEHKTCVHVRRCYIKPKMIKMIMKYGYSDGTTWEEVSDLLHWWFKT